ncbi:MAG TPA: MraY family glycosyltransferase [Clostridia bacterium]|nr:MraY family glycosyltransferase [Clostridia bacterium]
MQSQEESTVSTLVTGSLSLILTSIAVPLVRWAALRWGFLDRPDGYLKPQAGAVPYGGGIAVVVGTSCALLWVRPVLLAIPIAGALLVLVLGVVDDSVGVRPVWRLVAGLVAGSTLLALWPVTLLQLPARLLMGTCCAILASAAMNAINMTDGSDGLSGTVSLLAAAGLLVGWSLAGQGALANVAAATCGGIAGFLIFNWPPARIYLGDAGAYWIGFVLTALCIPALSSWHAVIGVMCVMALLEIELLASVLRRLRGHHGLATGDRRHIYDVVHLRLGQSATKIDVLYGLVGVISSGVGILVWRGETVILGLVWLAALSMLVVLLYRWSACRKVVVR